MDEDGQDDFRGIVGKIGWLGSLSRPDLAYDHVMLSSKLGKANWGDMKTAIKVIKKLKMEKSEMSFPELGSPEDWSIEGYGDAGYKSLPDKVSSCGGHVILLCNKIRGVSCVVNWRSRKLKRVVSSSTAAESLAINDCLDELFYVKFVLIELLGKQAIF